MKGCLLVILAALFIIGISWLATCGLIYLIMLCFGCEFSWGIATGVWLILLMVSSFFRRSSTNSKK